MEFTRDGQVNMELIDRRDNEYGMRTTENKKNRMNIDFSMIM